ncbi:putative amino acid/polyamine transporter I, cationic amino acid transporter [Arabidopsis thaliana]|uniref:Cationic amino acid transporter 7, chloroplastic n=4 Tax=Arabidopsis TaxID=3701 RepID=CAAT7_ARATH|nr:cationic amino acid transporter 7 [Arabidopsis thaliana]Q9SQZ0.1 RecName: Full=Cationic amino acid transporter 7, chloroplastic; Flags: Precursor [Arabidopsis thaliana]KAG7624736.1 Amino acid/polyamine transporter I [Arabidopsis thaliana x Arabidopsis arenosa]AAF76365.1 amino acid transporter, putative [Arabidopsis thaliana]AAG51376.1 putative amino acid transporter; 33388-30195 [Arabidopsis thaliana]AEE74933.1 cationic amino acid transporter 7 [Arabidopsis thaliana]CAD5322640.1 unnamed pr|eukprot:NP_187671.1 cationic amino acid transporter 7 [Arabidopsis thaliana]
MEAQYRNHDGDTSFSSLRVYLNSLSDTPSRFSRRAVSVSTSYDEMSRVRAVSGEQMRRTLRWYDLIGLGIGGMIGAGVFVTTGRASRLYAGPSIVVSYAIAGLCALLSAFCYTEFAVHLPVAGGAFSYIRITFGEFPAFITGANLIMDYVLSNAAVSRGFTAYLGSAFGISTSEWRFIVSGLPNGFNEIDPIAVIVVLAVTFVICYSTRESSKVNMVLTALHIAFIVFVIVMGFSKGDVKNLTRPDNPENPSGFFPFGVSGVFNGAAMVYLSYIGYDAVSTMAEEVKDPVKDIPMGISGSVAIVIVLYCLMAISMSMLLPYDLIDAEAPYSAAFSKSEGWEWVTRVVGIGASFGILTSLIVAMLGQARYMCVIGRSRVVPIWFAKVHPKTSTPVNASAFLGIFTAVLALFTDLNVLLNLVSIGTLFVFYMVANAVIFRRYVTVGYTEPWPTLSFLCLFSITSILFTLVWQLAPSGPPKWFILGASTVTAIAIVQIFHCVVPQARIPEFWGVPLMPWTPCVSIFLNIFLLGSLDAPSYIRFGFFSGLVVLVYVFYSVHASYDAEGDGSLDFKDVESLERINRVLS